MLLNEYAIYIIVDYFVLDWYYVMNDQAFAVGQKAPWIPQGVQTSENLIHCMCAKVNKVITFGNLASMVGGSVRRSIPTYVLKRRHEFVQFEHV